jgi:hypothetical protein
LTGAILGAELFITTVPQGMVSSIGRRAGVSLACLLLKQRGVWLAKMAMTSGDGVTPDDVVGRAVGRRPTSYRLRR